MSDDFDDAPDDAHTPLLAAQHGAPGMASGAEADAEAGGAAPLSGGEEERELHRLGGDAGDAAADAPQDTPRAGDGHAGKAAEGEDDAAQYGRLAAVLALLLVGYGATRLACLGGLPYDAGDTRCACLSALTQRPNAQSTRSLLTPDTFTPARAETARWWPQTCTTWCRWARC